MLPSLVNKYTSRIRQHNFVQIDDLHVRVRQRYIVVLIGLGPSRRKIDGPRSTPGSADLKIPARRFQDCVRREHRVSTWMSERGHAAAYLDTYRDSVVIRNSHVARR